MNGQKIKRNTHNQRFVNNNIRYLDFMSITSNRSY